MAKTKPKSKRGGARPGAGRKKKGHAASSALSEIDLKAALAAAVPDDIEGLAQTKARGAIAALVKLMMFGKSEQAKVAAANKILDRGWGKPSVEIGGMSQLSLFAAGRAGSIEMSTQIRDEARKYTTLAVEVLWAIADRGETEGAKASAAGSLLDRGVGTVAIAKVPAGAIPAPLGKKETAAREAHNAAAGRYATPAAPQAPETVQ